MISTRTVVAGVLLLSVSLAGRGARADEPAALFDGGADLLSQARSLWREGTDAYRKGQHDRARLLYLSALRAQKHFQIAGSLGHVEFALGRYRDAAEHVSFYLRETRDLPGASPRDRAMLEQDLAAAQARIGVVIVSVEPKGAEVFVDGTSVGRAPLADPVFVDPGRHVIEARLEGYQSTADARDVTPGSRAELALRLPRAVAAPRPPPMALRPVAERPAMPIAPVRGTLKDPVVIGGAAVTVVGASVGAALTGWWASLGGSGECLHRTDPTPCEREWATVKSASVWTFAGAGLTGLGTLTYTLLARRQLGTAKPARAIGPGKAAGSFAFEW